MKKIILISLLLFSVGSNYAQNTFKKSQNNYFVLTRKVPQLKAIILAAQKLAVQDGKKFGEFRVVICGQAVKDLTDANKIDEFITLAQENHVQLYACGFSLNKFNVSEEEIPKQIQVVENGILYGFELQKSGFYSLTL